jgi:hypothetical protein
MFEWLRRKWRAYRMARQLAAELHPERLLELALEVRALADAASRVCPPERRLQSRIRGIITEVERLSGLAATPQFRQLPSEKRQVLRRGLVQSREQLLRVMGHVPAPTKRLQ